jgi:glycosyltransferase involved in cell wall biosynthesis
VSSPRFISVVVPTYNRPVLLGEAVASIRALEATDFQFEILVCDNGQTRETQNIADHYGAKYIPVSIMGAGAARNAGLLAATGEFIAFLDDDDIWLKGHLKGHVELLDSAPELDAVLAQVVSTDSDLRPISDPWPKEHPGEGNALVRKMLSGYFPQIGSLVVRRSACEGIGLFDNHLTGGQDLDWMLRIARRHKLGFVSVPSVLFRTKPDGVYDELYRRRAHFDRVVFLRHALSEWRIWKSPRQFLQAYTGALSYFFWYFNSVALTHAQSGNPKCALRAVGAAYYVFPMRAFYHTIFGGNLGKALFLALRQTTKEKLFARGEGHKQNGRSL